MSKGCLSEDGKLCLGVIGTGRIAKRFASCAAGDVNIALTCVYNPHPGSAKRYAEECGVLLYTEQWQEFLENVDAAYIASPHETHYEYAKALLEQGKHVLCEKPMSLRASQARELFRLAEEQGCVLMEAIKTAYCPGFLALLETVRSGKIGRVCDVEACFTKLEQRESRELTDILYGGSVTELGSYVLLPIIKLLGTHYERLSFLSLKEDNGLDVYTKIILEYADGMAMGKVGLGVKSEGQLLISGTKGYILAESPWWLTKKFEVRYENPVQREVYTFPFEGAGLQYEVAAFFDRIRRGRREEDWKPEESVAIAAVMEAFLKERE